MRVLFLLICVCCTVGLAAEKELSREDFDYWMDKLKNGRTPESQLAGARSLVAPLTRAQRAEACPKLIKALDVEDAELQTFCLKALSRAEYWTADHVPALEKLLSGKKQPAALTTEVLLAITFLGSKAKSLSEPVLRMLGDKKYSESLAADIYKASWATDPAAAFALFKREHRMGLAYNPDGLDIETLQAALADLNKKFKEQNAAAELILKAPKFSALGGEYELALEDALRSDSRYVRKAALRLMDSVGWAPAKQIVRLKDLLRDPPMTTLVLNRFAELGEPARSAEPEILRCLNSKDNLELNAALNAARILKLNVANETAEINDLLRKRETQQSALKLVESLGSKGLPFLPYLSASVETNVATKTMLNVLAAIGDEGLGPLVRAMNATNGDVSGAAYSLLLEHPHLSAAAPHFVELLMSGRNFDPIGVGIIANKCPEIAERLSGPFALSLAKAANVLKETGKHDSRLMSMLGLATKLGPHAAAATPALIELLAVNQYRMNAQFALAAIGPSAVPAVMALVQSKEPAQIALGLQTIRAMGPGARAALPDLVQLIDKTPKLSRDAVEAMIAMKLEAKDAEPLLRLILSEDFESRRGVLRVLRFIQPPPEGALEPMLQLARRGEWEYDVDELCVALGERAAPGAATFLTDKEPQVRAIGGRLMRAMGKKMAPAKKELLQGLKSETVEVRAGCVYALGEIGDPATLDAIRALEQDADPKVRAAVKAAVDKF